jgi:hypothetical protein
LDAAPIQIEKHAPERRRRPAVTTLHCGCSCCCCCCCLHSLGGVLVAAIAPAVGPKAPLPITYYYDEQTETKVKEVGKPGFPSVLVFWWVFMVLCLLAVLAGTILFHGSSGARESDWLLGIVISLVVLLLIMPGLQIAALVITFIAVACMPRRDKAYQFVQLGKIGLGIIVGSVAGVLAMMGIGALLGGLSGFR